MCLSMMTVVCNKQQLSTTSEAKFMKKLNSTEDELKKALLIKKACTSKILQYKTNIVLVTL